MVQKGPNGPETLLTCIIHNYRSYWPALGPFRCPRGAKRAISAQSLKLLGPNFGSQKKSSEYRHVGCPESCNGMPCSYIAVADHIEPSNASEAVSELVLAPGGPLEGPEGPWTSPRGQIWAQMPAVSPPGWTASISSALATQETFTALPGPPKGPVLAPGGPLGAPEFFTPNIGKWGVQSDATVCPDHKPPFRSI